MRSRDKADDLLAVPHVVGTRYAAVPIGRGGRGGSRKEVRSRLGEKLGHTVGSSRQRLKTSMVMLVTEGVRPRVHLHCRVSPATSRLGVTGTHTAHTHGTTGARECLATSFLQQPAHFQMSFGTRERERCSTIIHLEVLACARLEQCLSAQLIAVTAADDQGIDTC